MRKGVCGPSATAEAAEMMWQAHRSDAAITLWQSLVPWESVDSLGHMHEVMSGSFFTPQRESVPEQTWSSSAFLSAAIHGMLGLESDGRKNVMHFAPQVPDVMAVGACRTCPGGQEHRRSRVAFRERTFHFRLAECRPDVSS